MLQAFVVVFREGFESFLIVGIILAYLRRIGEHRLVPAMYWGIAASVAASAGLGYMLNRGVNESLWEGLFTWKPSSTAFPRDHRGDWLLPAYFYLRWS
ncbi:MAG: hypothetical protein AUG08_05415 [Acidobacteria bacterium 13_1_20CM_2_55_15]|nr:MAG: hypothetical protein AUG08_05415 [Acidobacteria bacterium 13_1_20CM_2_55_15]